jgi:hypothetical protein
MRKTSRFMVLTIAVLCGLALSPSDAQAALVTIQIEAVVDSVEDRSNYLEGNIGVGDLITGFYVYESTTPDSSPSDPVQGNYWHYAPPAGIALTVGGFNFMTDPFNTAFHVAVRNSSTREDSYWLATHNNLPLSNGTPVDYIFWQLNYNTGNALSSDALPTTAPLLGDCQTNVLGIDADRMYGITAHVTSAIPEPCTILLFGLGTMLLRKRR